MRVGILTYALDRPLSGISRYTVELVRALAEVEQGPELVLLTAGGPGPLVDLDLSTVRLPGCRLLPSLISLGNAYIPFFARQLELDIVHDTTGMFPFLLGSGRARRITTLYDVIPWSFPGVSTRWDTLVYRHLLPRRLPHVDAVLTISQASKSDIARYLAISEANIHNVSAGVRGDYRPPDGTQPAALSSRLDLPSDYILFVGSVEERKNLRRVLEAFARIRNVVPHKLVVAGARKWKYPEIDRMLAILNLDERVIFTGYVDDADLPTLYSHAALFVFPSLYEGFGLPVLEAMACGTPVVTSNVSSLPEVAGEAAIMVDPYDVEALAAAMRRVLDDGALRQQMSAKGLVQARQFTWERTAIETMNVYEQVLSSQSLGRLASRHMPLRWASNPTILFVQSVHQPVGMVLPEEAGPNELRATNNGYLKLLYTCLGIGVNTWAEW